MATPVRASCSRTGPSCWILFLPPGCPTTSTRRMTMPESSTSSLDRIRSDQLARLRTRLPAVLRSNPFWRQRLRDVIRGYVFGLSPPPPRAPLMPDQNPSPPFGTNLTHPGDRYVRMHQTSGSSGARPLRWLDDAESWSWWRRVWAEH